MFDTSDERTKAVCFGFSGDDQCLAFATACALAHSESDSTQSVFAFVNNCLHDKQYLHDEISSMDFTAIYPNVDNGAKSCEIEYSNVLSSIPELRKYTSNIVVIERQSLLHHAVYKLGQVCIEEDEDASQKLI